MLSKRNFAAALASSVLLACTPKFKESHPENPSMTASPILLVHGAWHGGWVWEDLASILKKSGRTVFTPTLKGLGERSDELDKEISLKDHIDDIINVIEANELDNITLVGHSYGGMVITGVIDALPEKVSHVVYVDSVVPKHGQSMSNVGEKIPPETQEANDAAIRALSEDGVSFSVLPPEIFGIPKGHEKYDWVAERLTPHPLKTWFDPISLKNETRLGLPKTFIHSINPVLQPSSIPYFAGVAKQSNDWGYYELNTGHDSMVTAPEELAEILLSLAQK